ncbi:unnamed protein product [Diatraea saccharalis]|uniref:unspecific monooxygenase n=1 Tax=Diatraea saccharalis TaxID=40085 RepID=A0A9N9QXH2_9NEOP|nr:unnamed protein product [Diatraea saccharalis]
MTWASIFIILTVIIVFLSYCVLKINKQYWWKLNIVGPNPHFLFGNYKDVILRRITSFELQEDLYNSYPKEKVVGLYRFNTPILLLRDLDIIQHVFISNFDSFVNRGMEFGDKFATNLASSNDETWRILRAQFSPLFTSGKLKNMLYLVERCGNKMLEQLDTEISMNCDIQKITNSFTMQAISSCAFGIDMNEPDKRLTRICKLIFRNYYALELFYICPNLIKKLCLDTMPSEVTNYFCNLVSFVKEQRNGKPFNRKDFMDLLLEMKNLSELKSGQKHKDKYGKLKVLRITDDLIAAQAMIFFAAGFESTANTLSYLLYEIAKHQDIQEKLLKEINQTLDNNKGQLSFDTLKQLSYMNQVYHETLRLYPVIDLQRKVSTSFCQIPGVDITLKRDDYVSVPVRGIHYDEKYYPDPHRFDPDRFLPENIKSRHPCAYMPFGLGPRHCIGAQFGKIQMQIFLVKFLACYKVEPAVDAKKFTYDPMKVTLSTKDGVYLNIIRRNARITNTNE